MVAAFDYCLHGRGGAAPSIDTAMHGLVDAPHVDHLHPDCGHRARHGGRRRGADQGVLRRPGAVGALAPARVPARAGHRRASTAANPQAIGVILGGHGITAWGATSEECEAHSLEIIQTAQAFLDERGTARAVRRRRSPATSRCPRTERRARAAALAPVIRGLASTDRPQVGHFTDSDVVLDFLARERAPAAGRAGHLLPGPLPAHQGPAAGAGPARRRARWSEVVARLRELHAAYRDDYAAYYERHADAGLAGDARRRPGDRARPGRGHVQLRQGQADRPGGRRVLRQRDQRDARRRGDLDATRRSTSRRSSASSTGRWRRRSSRRMPDAEAAGRPGRAGHRRRLGHRPGHRPPARRRGACVVVADRDADAAADGRRGDRQPRTSPSP